MIDIEKLKKANAKFDSKFAEDYPEFTAWWAKHPHCDEKPKWAVSARVAYKCERYQDEFLGSKQIGLV